MSDGFWAAAFFYSKLPGDRLADVMRGQRELCEEVEAAAKDAC